MQGGMKSKEKRDSAAAATAATSNAPDASLSAAPEAGLVSPARAAHMSPSPDSAAAAEAAADAPPVLTELSDNVLPDSSVGGSPCAVGLHRRAKTDAAPENGVGEAGAAQAAAS